jgi:hypothetical protein
MEPQDADATEELSSVTESEYGGGTELSASGFLVLGLISYWTYTSGSTTSCCAPHLAARRVHFSERLDADKLAPEDSRVHDVLVSKGFTCPTRRAQRVPGLVCSQPGADRVGARRRSPGRTRPDRDGGLRAPHPLRVGGAALLFAAASVHFMSWVARSTREHEYHELLLARFVQDPSRFRMLAPSTKFTTRWSRNQSRVALFLVLAVPMTIAPVFAAQQTLRAGETLVAWVALLFVFAGIFHFAGTRLLIEMHNGHLRVEALNREMLDRTTARGRRPRTQSVLDEAGAGEESAPAGPESWCPGACSPPS